MDEYDFASKHIVGLDDSATDDISITVRKLSDEYVVEISSPDALETVLEDVGVFVGDIEADFCGDPRPVLTINEPLAGARWKPTKWNCYLSGYGNSDDDIHVFPVILNE